MCDYVRVSLSNQLIKKFPVFSTVRVLTNSEFTTARYWTLVKVQRIPSILSLRIYSDLCLVLIVNHSIARSLESSPIFKRKNKFMYYSNVLHVLCDKPMTVPDIISFTTYSLWLLDETTCLTLNVVHSACTVYLYDSYRPQNKERIFHYIINWFMTITETECVYCWVRTKYLTVIQVGIRVGKVNVVWGVGLVVSCKGMKTPLESANKLFKGLHRAESFLGSEYTIFTSIT